ncbi:MAG: LapA family protein [Spirochaetota bacterium]
MNEKQKKIFIALLIILGIFGIGMTYFGISKWQLSEQQKLTIAKLKEEIKKLTSQINDYKQRAEEAEAKAKEEHERYLANKRTLEKWEEELKKRKIELDALADKIAKGMGLKTYQLFQAGILGRWSSIQGRMDWNEAKEKCAELAEKDGVAWRLPKKGEWQINYGTNSSLLSKQWYKETIDEDAKASEGLFWTADQYSKIRAYYFKSGDGRVGNIRKYKECYVRCIR